MIQPPPMSVFSQRPVEPPRGLVVEVLDGGRLAEPRVAQPRLEPPLGPGGRFLVEQQAKARSSNASSSMPAIAAWSSSAWRMPAKRSSASLSRVGWYIILGSSGVS